MGKRTFQNCRVYRSGNVLFVDMEVFKGQGNDTEVLTRIGCQSNLCTERGGQMRKKYYDDAKENAAFERCVDVVTSLILKYGPAIKRKWILREWIKNIQADCFWRSLACK